MAGDDGLEEGIESRTELRLCPARTLNSLRRAAETAVEVLASRFPDASFALFGSVARSEAKLTSDIDIFVVNPVDALRPSQMLRIVRGAHRPSAAFNFVSVSTHGGQAIFAEGRLLAFHLWHEAKILHDRSGELRRLFSGRPALDIDSETRRGLARLGPYRDERPFNGNLLLCLAQDYSVGRSLSMLGLASCGIPEFDRHRAFVRLRTELPSLAEDLSRLESLEPFHARAHGRGPVDLPWSPLQDGDGRSLREHRKALTALERVCRTLSDR